MQQKWLKFGVKTNVIIMIIIAISIFGLVNYINYRHYKRFDWTRSSMYELSDKTKKILESLPDTINITVFYQPGHLLFSSVENMLKEYAYISNKIKVEYVDPDKDVAKVEILANKFNIDALNVVVFSYKNKHKTVSDLDIVEYEVSNTQMGEEPKIKGFKGEEAFTGAILNILSEKSSKIYFVTGHGEHDFLSTSNKTSLKKAFNSLKRDNLQVESLFLNDKQSIPQDADVLIIAGPASSYSDTEMEILDKYLSQGGKLFAACDPMNETRLEGFFKKWGIILNNDFVVDPGKRLPFISESNLYIDNYTDHPIVKNIKSTATLYHLARSLELNIGEANIEGQSLALTSEEGWGESDFSDTYDFNPAKDKKGPIAIGIAVKNKKNDMRIVVFGDSDFFTDEHIGTLGNNDIFMNAVNWLLVREKLISIGPKTPQNIYLTLNSSQLKNIFWFSVIGLPLFSMIIGIIVLFIRRR